MSDLVAVASVVTSGVVGISGLAAAAVGATRQRRWEASELRAQELRGVLDDAAMAVAGALQAFGSSNAQVTLAIKQPRARDECLERSRQLFEQGGEYQTELWRAWNRLRVRAGPDAPISRALLDAQHSLGLVADAVGNRRRSLENSDADYLGRWQRAADAEKAFYQLAADEHGAPQQRRRRLGLGTRQ